MINDMKQKLTKIPFTKRFLFLSSQLDCCLVHQVLKNLCLSRISISVSGQILHLSLGHASLGQSWTRIFSKISISCNSSHNTKI